MATQRLTVPELVALEPGDRRWDLPAVAYMRDRSVVDLGGRSLRQAHEEMTRDADADVWFGAVNANDLVDFGVVIPDASGVVMPEGEQTSPSRQDVEPRIAPLGEGEERLLQAVQWPDGDRNDVYLIHPRPNDEEVTGTGERINFVTVVRSSSNRHDPSDFPEPEALQVGPDERTVYIRLAESFVNVPPPPNVSVTLDADVQWFVDRIRESTGPAASPMEELQNWSHLYTTVCLEVIAAARACIEPANRSVGARSKIEQHKQDGLPGTPIAIRNFTSWAETAEQEFAPLYEAFKQACGNAREAAGKLLAAGRDPAQAEMVLAMHSDEATFGAIATVKSILRASYGATPAAFIQGVQESNALMEADSAEDASIYTPLPSAQTDEKVCPWCAETIKAAAVICRFCGRDVQPQPNIA